MPKQILTVGHDAELFLYDENDKAYPSIGLVVARRVLEKSMVGQFKRIMLWLK
jgi:hypothetical protein